MHGKSHFLQTFFGSSFGLCQSLLGPFPLDKGNRGFWNEIGQDNDVVELTIMN